MLTEMTSPAFRENGKARPPIKFHKGLNVVLGMVDDNSIGKSSALQAIDFVFGGDTYLKGDWGKYVGNHTIYFTFQFDKPYYFARSTGDSDEIIVCKKDRLGYQQTDEKWPKHQYIDWLAEKYGINYPGLSFRQVVSSFFRIHLKANVSESETPLYGVKGDNMQKSLDRLITLFNRYKDIEPYKNKLDEQKDKLATYKSARKYRFVSDIVGGDKQYEENLKKINGLQVELDNLTSQQTEYHSDEDIQKNKQKVELRGRKLQLETTIEAKRRRLKLLDMSLEYGLYPSQADLESLQEFFPDTNIRKLYEVENYHKRLAQILDDQFENEKRMVQAEIAELTDQKQTVDDQIKALGFVGNISKDFLDKHSELLGTINALKQQNESYLTLKDLREAQRHADQALKNATERILTEIQDTINEKMAEYNGTLYSTNHKPPFLRIKSYSSYSFETPSDIGSAAAYKAKIIYDLAVLNTTGLPAVAHDSLLFGDLGFGLVDGIMRLYERNEKQIFISFDRAQAYNLETQRILNDHTVLHLYDGNRKLYGQSWNTTEEES